MINIRLARPEDIPALFEMIAELAEFEKISDQLTGTADDLAKELFGSAPVVHALVAERADELIGYGIYFYNFSTFRVRRGVYIEDIYIKPEHRGGGAGKTLLAEIRAVAERAGCARLEWVVLDWNKNAIDFYERLGAEVLPDWRICRTDLIEIKK